MEIFAKKLSNKPVVDDDGSVIGQLHNVTINFRTGELNNLLITPEGNKTQRQRQKSRYQTNDQGRYLIPASNVSAVKDQIIVQKTY